MTGEILKWEIELLPPYISTGHFFSGVSRMHVRYCHQISYALQYVSLTLSLALTDIQSRSKVFATPWEFNIFTH